jgi:lysophospholipase L1-like esterase
LHGEALIILPPFLQPSIKDISAHLITVALRDIFAVMKLLLNTLLLQPLVWLIFLPNLVEAQDPLRFQKEIDSLTSVRPPKKGDVIVFTGSSSIRLWKGLSSSFPNHNVLNLGFGGSEMADLLYYTDKLILPLRPIQVFIYEGDNDISKGRPEAEILASADSILRLIRRALPQTQLVFISPKPSVARWNLKEKYESFNVAFKDWIHKHHNVVYADVWTPMLDKDGKLKQDLFAPDNLHLNSKGYKIWTDALRKHLLKTRN